MAAFQPVSLGVRSNPGRHGQDSAARLINCYAEDAGEEGKIRFPLYASPGFSTFASLAGTGGVKAMLTLSNSVMYAVAGGIVFSITSAGVVTALGGFQAGTRVFMARNRRTSPQVAIVSNGQYFLIDGGTLSQINDPDLPAPNSVCFFNGYFVFTIEDGRYFISSLEQGNAIDPLDFASAETNADGLLVGCTRGSELVLMGPRSIEFHVADPNAEDFPFAYNAGVNIGCYAAGSVCEVTIILAESRAVDSVAWAATDAQGAYAGVMLLDGYTGIKISTHAVDRSIRDEPDRDSIRGFTWSEGGHTFYCLVGSTFSWVYDTVTRLWHERASHGLARWRIASSVTFGSTVILGDYDLGHLYRMSHTAYDEAGEPLVMTVQPPAVHAWPNRMRFNAIRLDMIPGTGLNSTVISSSNPRLLIDHSNDNGKSWLPQRAVEFGRQGEFARQVKLFRFGDSKEDGKVFRFSVSAPVVKGITGFAVDADQLDG